MEGRRGRAPLLVGALGFSEKLLVRCVMRVYATRGLSGVAVLVPSQSDSYSREKISTAMNSLRSIVEGYMGVPVEFREVPRTSFAAAFHETRSILGEAAAAGRAVVLCMSTGMRHMLLAMLAAGLSLTGEAGQEALVEVDLESGEGYFTIPLGALRGLASLGPLEARILEALWAGEAATLPGLSEALGVPRSTLWRILRRLEAQGLIAKRGPRGGYKPLFPPGEAQGHQRL
ncbi:MAG: helix-turn-helix domain-containing protein [Desulfurococcales archaeon]|nr:helix-turn-helix domain-containing protein [Desulfurococcales archaeon]